MFFKKIFATMGIYSDTTNASILERISGGVGSYNMEVAQPKPLIVEYEAEPVPAIEKSECRWVMNNGQLECHWF